jgi:hypothetical protein
VKKIIEESTQEAPIRQCAGQHSPDPSSDCSERTNLRIPNVSQGMCVHTGIEHLTWADASWTH